MSLSAHNLSCFYDQQPILQSVCLRLAPGQVAALVGPNGSGKSTLLRCIAGLVPCQGTLTMFGQSQKQFSRISYMPQDTSALAALTVVEAVLLGRIKSLKWQVLDDDLEAVEAVLRRLGIVNLASRDLRELSGGQRQLVFLAQALVAESQVLLLDEPISALDLRHQLEVMEIVSELTRERSLISLIVLHDLNIAARYAKQLLLLKGGRLFAQGATDDVFSVSQIERVFDIETELLHSQQVERVMVPLRVKHDVVST